MPRALQIVGQEFGLLTAIEPAGRDANGRLLWSFSCKCGGQRFARASSVKSGLIRTCGCGRIANWSRLVREGKTHGLSKTRTYAIWCGIKERCGNPRKNAYKNYGGRGISVCERWRSFENFFADMGPCPKGLTLERIDNNGNYELKNCQWASRAVQARNNRRNVIVTIGDQTRCLHDWVSELRLGRSTVYRKMRAGATPKQAIIHAAIVAGVVSDPAVDGRNAG